MAEEATDATGDPDAAVLTVAELNERIAAAVDAADALQDVRCRGEVTDCHESSVAVYFSLVSDGASIECVLWRTRYRDMDVDLADGIEVVLHGTVDYYAEKGRINVKPWDVHPVGEGERRSALKRLERDLEARGWFDDERKRDLPRVPECVGVVTSREGDARHDIATAVHERYPDVDILLCHASVQGDDAPVELAEGIARLDEHDAVDVIVVGRGGGSDEDLVAFNTEVLADAIHAADTPVVSAVGHREDRTIADRVADVSAITPTDVGATVVEEKAALLEELEAMEAALAEAYTAFARERLADLEARLDDAYAALERRHEKARAVEQAREEALAEARARGVGVPLRYKAAIVGLTLLVLVLTALLLWLVVL